MQSISIYKLRLHWIKRFGSPVLIWNMGKVASTSIARSLWKPLGRHNVLTTHFMDNPAHPRSVALHQILLKTGGAPPPVLHVGAVLLKVGVAFFLLGRLTEGSQSFPLLAS